MEIYFGNNLEYLRKLNKKSQTEVAEIIGKKRSIVSAYENSVSSSSLDVLVALVELFGVTLDQLVFSDLSKKETTISNKNAVNSTQKYIALLTEAKEENTMLKSQILDKDKIIELLSKNP